jgi:hypothetical protein
MDEVMNPMKTTDCQNIKGLMTLLEEGDLSPDQDLRIKEHLAGCPTCGKDLEETRKILNLFSRDRLPDREPAFWKGLSNQIMAEVRHGSAREERVPWYRKIWAGPFQWPGYAWATALILFVLTPLAIYTIQGKSKTPYPVIEMTVSQLRGEFGFEPYVASLETFSAREADRLGEKVTARLEKELTDSPARVEEPTGEDLLNSLENLNQLEMDTLMQRMKTDGVMGSKEVKSDVV